MPCGDGKREAFAPGTASIFLLTHVFFVTKYATVSLREVTGPLLARKLCFPRVLPTSNRITPLSSLLEEDLKLQTEIIEITE